MTDIRFWVGFSLIPGIGRVRFQQLERHFGDLEQAWKAPTSELRQAGLDRRAVESILTGRSRISLDEEMEKLERSRVKVLIWPDPAYPSRLKEIPDPPPLLYLRGTLLPEDEVSLAVVGTRRATAYGREVAEGLVSDLVHSRITIVSGLARGIDSVAHRTALETGGRTIAVFGCGLDHIYPPENLKLAQAIQEQGALVSEYPLGTLPRAENFPRRNRIMSGLALGVLVVEAGDASGALRTVEHALDQGREVFAVPGSILSPASRGTNRLIQEGAKLVRSAQDILEELNLTMIPRQLEMKELAPADEPELALLKLLSREPTHIDDLYRRCGLPVATVSGTLAVMELKGMVKQVGGMNYVLVREAQEAYGVRE
ncbi:MAG: DNA-processing protein DprA [Chloroflexota bacterium]|nr:DNA-processing protein DprA [Chloroflexota bacterium]